MRVFAETVTKTNRTELASYILNAIHQVYLYTASKSTILGLPDIAPPHDSLLLLFLFLKIF